MKRIEWQSLHGFTDEDMQRIDDCKSIFGGTITGVFTNKEMSDFKDKIKRDNKMNVDRLFIK